jgi:Holliday junction resolvase
MAYSNYEREFKMILQGREETVRRIIRTCDTDTHFNYLKILKKPFIVIRAAGSFGVDLVAIRGDVSFPIEVKASATKLLHFSDNSGRALRQAAELKAECERANVFPIYAHRLKRVKGDDPWRISTVEVEGLSGRNKTLHRAIPRVRITRAGNIALSWDEAMPLNRFIDYLC